MTAAKKLQESPPIPLEFGSPGQFDSVRSLLESSGYTPEKVCERLGIASMFELESLHAGPMTTEGLESKADVLIWLFLGAKPLDRSLVRRFLSDGEIDTLAQLGLLVTAASGDDLLASVLLYPVESVYLVSDLPINRDDGSPVTFPDSVYPPITVSAGWFLSMLPRTRCDSFLELCGGTGVAALLASGTASQSCSVDITERSTIFAKFNGALNDADGFRALQGDLYQPVGDETFDRIVAHPPYMPAAETARIFRDGGPDGEEITRGIMGGLAGHLRPGGRLLLTAILSDRTDTPVEARVREMLGPDESQFDVVVVSITEFHPMVHYGGELWRGVTTATELEPQLARLRTLGIQRMVLCTVVVQRPREPREVFTARRSAGPKCDARALEWLLNWEEKAADPELDRWLANHAPRSLETLELRASHRMEEGGWKPVGLELGTSNPFEHEVPCGAWVAEFLHRCDGTRSAMSILQSMKQEGAVPSEAPDDEFARMVRGLAAAGFVQFDDAQDGG